MKPRRAAHFISSEKVWGNPSNEAHTAALLSVGYDVDVYCPGPAHEIEARSNIRGLRFLTVEYGYRWLLRNIISRHWLQYRLFSGTTEDPMAVAGLLARVYRAACITIADEIKNGSYAGDRTQRWKSLCRFGMRASRLTMVNDAARVSIQREYAGLSSNSRICVFPNALRGEFEPLSRALVRQRLGIPEDAFVVCYSGVFNIGNGGMWFVRAVASCPTTWFWAQAVVDQDALAGQMLGYINGSERLRLEFGPLGWRYPSASMPAADVGIVLYLQDAPQFQNMGVASNRLCMFLSMGVPVIASRQQSFKFIEDYGCGILVDTVEEFIAAITAIRPRAQAMRDNALRCAREYIAVDAKFDEFVQAVQSL